MCFTDAIICFVDAFVKGVFVRLKQKFLDSSLLGCYTLGKGDEDVNERIKELRKALGLTQQEFADAINIKRGSLANYEVGRNEPIDAVISLICREFSVNEAWLRGGAGEMFVRKDVDAEISDFVGDVLQGEPDFRRRFISVLAKMTPEEWRLLERKIHELATAPARDYATTGDVQSLQRQLEALAARQTALEQEEQSEELSPGTAAG